jgi:hypothetical protein
MKASFFRTTVVGQIVATAVSLLIVESVAHAQPGLSLGQVQTIAPWVEGRPEEIALLTNQLADSLGKAKVFTVVQPQEGHDAWLVLRTCDRHGRYLPPSSEGAPCGVFLSDAHAVHEQPIWYMSASWIRSVFILTANKQEAVAVLTYYIGAAARDQRKSLSTDARPAATPNASSELRPPPHAANRPPGL